MNAIEKMVYAYKINLITEINEYKAFLIKMGFDWPSKELNPNNYTENELEEFYSEIMGYVAIHNYRAKYYPHTSGR